MVSQYRKHNTYFPYMPERRRRRLNTVVTIRRVTTGELLLSEADYSRRERQDFPLLGNRSKSSF